MENKKFKRYNLENIDNAWYIFFMSLKMQGIDVTTNNSTKFHINWSLFSLLKS